MMKHVILYVVLFVSQASANTIDWSTKELEPIHKFFSNEEIPQNDWPDLVYIDEKALPNWAAQMLTKPLLTPAIASYYQRTPKIRAPLQVEEDVKNKRYYRAIIMVIDTNAKRDDALLADTLNESSIVELGLISINFAALPQSVIDGVVRNGRGSCRASRRGPWGPVRSRRRVARATARACRSRRRRASHAGRSHQCRSPRCDRGCARASRRRRSVRHR